MAKIRKGDPCWCGSAKRFKDCCGRRRSVNQAKQSESAREVQLNATIRTRCEKVDPLAAIRTLALNALYPDTQKYELRYFHLVELVLSQFSNHNDGIESSFDFGPLLRQYDPLYGRYFPANEYDFQNIPFLSWIDWNDATYRMPSGSYAEPELYFRDLVRKGRELDGYLTSKHGFSFSSVLDQVLPRVHRFLSLAGIDVYESRNVNDCRSDFRPRDLTDAAVTAFDSTLVFPKDGLSSGLHAAFRLVSKKVGQYEPDLNAVFAGKSDIMNFPVVECAECYVLPFPQLLIPALLNCVPPPKDDPEIASKLRILICARSFKALARRFSYSSAQIVMMPRVASGPIADIAVLFDRKLLLFTAFYPGSRAIDNVIEKSAQCCLNAFATGETLIRGNNRTSATVDSGPLEVFHFAVIDNLHEWVAPIPDPPLPDGHSFDVLTCKTLEYVATQTVDELEFVKFFRMRNRAHEEANLMEISGPILDSFAIFKRGRWLKPVSTKAKVIFVDNHSFDAFWFEKLLDYRKKHAICVIDEVPREVVLNYPGNFLYIRESETVALFNWKDIAVEIRSSGPPSEKLFKQWHVSFDSLCYHLSNKAHLLQGLLANKLSGSSRLRIRFEMDESQAWAINSSASKTDGVTDISILIAPSIAKVFASGDNSGERLVLGAFLEALGCGELDAILPLSADRTFQLIPYVLPHPSWDDNELTALQIYDCDQEIVTGEEWTALSAAGVKPGKRTSKDEIFSLLIVVLKSTLHVFNERVKVLNRTQLVEFAYGQLEAAYIRSERDKKELIYTSETAKFFDSQAAYFEATRKAVDLTFAIRFILESALQMDADEKNPVTLEGFSELLAFANRFIQIDFQGDALRVLERAHRRLPTVELSDDGFINIISNDDVDNERLLKYYFDSHQASAATRHQSQPESKAKTPSMPEVFDQALVDEFGFSLTQRVILDRVILSLFDEREIPIMITPQTELAKLLERRSSLASSVVRSYLERMTLSGDLLKHQGEIKPSEQFWRDAKIVNRPLVLLGENYLFSRSVVHLAQQIFLERLSCCRLDGDGLNTDTLKSALGAWSNLEGEEFKQCVMRKLDASGWRTDDEVAALNGVAMPKTGMGPIDIVAINRTAGRILVIETKRNYNARSPIDLLTELDNFHGKGSKKGEFERFAEKCEWFMSNLVNCALEYEIEDIAQWKVEHIFVSSELLMCASLKFLPFLVLSEFEFGRWIGADDQVNSEAVGVPHSG